MGDDWQLLLWDTNNPGAPAARVKNAHGEADLHCVDWSPLQPELLVTGRAWHMRLHAARWPLVFR